MNAYLSTQPFRAFAAAALIGAAGICGSPTSSSAQEKLPASGQLALRYTMVNTTTSAFGPTARGADAAAGISNSGGWISWMMRNDGGDGFGHKMAGRCSMLFGVGPTGVDALYGNCVYTDADGDKLFESLNGLTGTWTGGTGKYAGISGTVELTDVVVTAESGFEMASGVKVGSYSIN